MPGLTTAVPTASKMTAPEKKTVVAQNPNAQVNEITNAQKQRVIQQIEKKGSAKVITNINTVTGKKEVNVIQGGVLRRGVNQPAKAPEPTSTVQAIAPKTAQPVQKVSVPEFENASIQGMLQKPQQVNQYHVVAFMPEPRYDTGKRIGYGNDGKFGMKNREQIQQDKFKGSAQVFEDFAIQGMLEGGNTGGLKSFNPSQAVLPGRMISPGETVTTEKGLESPGFVAKTPVEKAIVAVGNIPSKGYQYVSGYVGEQVPEINRLMREPFLSVINPVEKAIEGFSPNVLENPLVKASFKGLTGREIPNKVPQNAPDWLKTGFGVGQEVYAQGIGAEKKGLLWIPRHLAETYFILLVGELINEAMGFTSQLGTEVNIVGGTYKTGALATKALASIGGGVYLANVGAGYVKTRQTQGAEAAGGFLGENIVQAGLFGLGTTLTPARPQTTGYGYKDQYAELQKQDIPSIGEEGARNLKWAEIKDVIKSGSLSEQEIGQLYGKSGLKVYNKAYLDQIGTMTNPETTGLPFTVEGSKIPIGNKYAEISYTPNEVLTAKTASEYQSTLQPSTSTERLFGRTTDVYSYAYQEKSAMSIQEALEKSYGYMPETKIVPPKDILIFSESGKLLYTETFTVNEPPTYKQSMIQDFNKESILANIDVNFAPSIRVEGFGKGGGINYGASRIEGMPNHININLGSAGLYEKGITSTYENPVKVLLHEATHEKLFPSIYTNPDVKVDVTDLKNLMPSSKEISAIQKNPLFQEFDLKTDIAKYYSNRGFGEQEINARLTSDYLLYPKEFRAAAPQYAQTLEKVYNNPTQNLYKFGATSYPEALAASGKYTPEALQHPEFIADVSVFNKKFTPTQIQDVQAVSFIKPGEVPSREMPDFTFFNKRADVPADFGSALTNALSGKKSGMKNPFQDIIGGQMPPSPFSAPKNAPYVSEPIYTRGTENVFERAEPFVSSVQGGSSYYASLNFVQPQIQQATPFTVLGITNTQKVGSLSKSLVGTTQLNKNRQDYIVPPRIEQQQLSSVRHDLAQDQKVIPKVDTGQKQKTSSAQDQIVIPSVITIQDTLTKQDTTNIIPPMQQFSFMNPPNINTGMPGIPFGYFKKKKKERLGGYGFVKKKTKRETSRLSIALIPDYASINATEFRTGKKYHAPKLTKEVVSAYLKVRTGQGMGQVPTEEMRRGSWKPLSSPKMKKHSLQAHKLKKHDLNMRRFKL